MYLTKRIKQFRIGPDQYLVLNALTGEISVMDAAGLGLVSAPSADWQSACDSAVTDQLKRKRFLFDSQEDEESFFEQLCEKSWREFLQGSSRHYTFIVNSHCNFNCRYCFERPELREKVSSLTPLQIDAAFRVIDTHEKRRGKAQAADVEIFGGEPLLPGSLTVLEHLMQCVAGRGLMASLQTNGYHLLHFSDFIAEYRESIRQVQVTLDGPQAVHDARRGPKSGGGSFDRIVAGIEGLLELRLPIRVNIRMNLDRENISHLATMAQFYKDRNWTANPLITYTAAPVDDRCGGLANNDALLGWLDVFQNVLPLCEDTSGGPFDLSVFKVLGYARHYLSVAVRKSEQEIQFVPKVLYCEAAALKLFVFHPDGRIYPCPEAVGMEPLAIGRYSPQYTLDRKGARLWRKQTILNRGRCRTCNISTVCGGGCVLTALMRKGSMAEPDCEQAPEILESYFAQIRQ